MKRIKTIKIISEKTALSFPIFIYFFKLYKYFFKNLKMEKNIFYNLFSCFCINFTKVKHNKIDIDNSTYSENSIQSKNSFSSSSTKPILSSNSVISFTNHNNNSSVQLSKRKRYNSYRKYSNLSLKGSIFTLSNSFPSNSTKPFINYEICEFRHNSTCPISNNRIDSIYLSKSDENCMNNKNYHSCRCLKNRNYCYDNEYPRTPSLPNISLPNVI